MRKAYILLIVSAVIGILFLIFLIIAPFAPTETQLDNVPVAVLEMAGYTCGYSYPMCFYEGADVPFKQPSTISCTSDLDCNYENTTQHCAKNSGRRGSMILCPSEKVYCDNGECKGCCN